MSEKTEKSPIYQKWWFWVIIAIVILAAIGGSSSTEQPQTSLTSGDTNTENNLSTTNNNSEIVTQKQDKKYEVGEIYQDSSMAIKYVSVDENFTGYNQYADVKEGHKIIKAEFEAENLGTSDLYFSAYNFKCYADGYDCESFWSVEGSGFSSSLSSQKKAKGAVYFEVPTNAQEIVIEYETNMFVGEKIEFKVK